MRRRQHPTVTASLFDRLNICVRATYHNEQGADHKQPTAGPPVGCCHTLLLLDFPDVNSESSIPIVFVS